MTDDAAAARAARGTSCRRRRERAHAGGAPCGPACTITRASPDRDRGSLLARGRQGQMDRIGPLPASASRRPAAEREQGRLLAVLFEYHVQQREPARGASMVRSTTPIAPMAAPGLAIVMAGGGWPRPDPGAGRADNRRTAETKPKQLFHGPAISTPRPLFSGGRSGLTVPTVDAQRRPGASEVP